MCVTHKTSRVGLWECVCTGIAGWASCSMYIGEGGGHHATRQLNAVTKNTCLPRPPPLLRQRPSKRASEQARGRERTNTPWLRQGDGEGGKGTADSGTRNKYSGKIQPGGGSESNMNGSGVHTVVSGSWAINIGGGGIGGLADSSLHLPISTPKRNLLSTIGSLHIRVHGYETAVDTRGQSGAIEHCRGAIGGWCRLECPR